MDLPSFFNRSPLVERLGIEITEAGDGRASGRLPVGEDILTHPDSDVIHGGATYTLADTVGVAAVTSAVGAVSPTVDMRIDYLAPATSELIAEAELLRQGGDISVVRVEIHDADGTHVATAHGTYKSGGRGEKTRWTALE